MRRVDGTATTSKTEARVAQADHFTDAFGSVRQPFREVVAHERKMLGTRIMNARLVPKDVELVPSEVRLSQTYATVN